MKTFGKMFLITVFVAGLAKVCLGQQGVYNGWTEEEIVMSRVLKIRAGLLEKRSGIKFDKDTKFLAELEWGLGSRNMRGTSAEVAEYKSETQTIHFVHHLTTEINVKYKSTFRLMDPAVIAKDDSLNGIADHELGHLLMDQVSRRNKLGVWYTVKRFEKLDKENQLGMNVVSEGVGKYFEYLLHPTDSNYSELCFPGKADEEQRFYTFEMVAFDGGYWLVRDIVKQHGEKGLVYIILHPFVAKIENMREAAVLYRKTALEALSKK